MKGAADRFFGEVEVRVFHLFVDIPTIYRTFAFVQ